MLSGFFVVSAARRYRCPGLVAWLLVACALAGCDSAGPTAADPSGSVTLLAAASTTDAVEEVASLFEAFTDYDVQISTGPSSGLAQQILAGAPADVFVSANKKWAQAVEEEGLAGESVELLSNRIVLIVPRGNPAEIDEPDDLLSSSVAHVAIAGENVPAGIYAQQVLASRQLFAPLAEQGKLARGHDVRATLAYVEQGEAEAGLVYSTDARISELVEVVSQFDPQTYDQVIYPLILLKRGAENQAAQQFYAFLQSAEARGVFERHGFVSLASQP